MKRRWLRFRRFIIQKVLQTNDSPHAIALGAAIAVFIAILPLVGIQMVVAVAVAALFRANKLICIPVVWITNPVTMGPIYYGCLYIGRWVLPNRGGEGDAALTQLVELARTGSLFDLDFWMDLSRLLAGVGVELWVGSVILGTALAIPSYFVAKAAVVAYRERRRQRLLRRNLYKTRATRVRVVRQREAV